MDLDAGMITALIALLTAMGGVIGGMVKGRRDGADIAQRAIESAQNFWATTIDRQNVELDQMAARIHTLEQGRDDYVRMSLHLESLHSWIERGSRPPPPVRPSWLTPGAFSPHATSTPSPITPIDNP